MTRKGNSCSLRVKKFVNEKNNKNRLREEW